jgi:YVTN family beta-propeller protein
MSKLPRYVLTVVAAIMVVAIAIKSSAATGPLYTLTKTVPLGGGIKWDYLHFDPSSDRLFVSHGTELTVIDVRTGVVVGHVTGLMGSHGIAIDPTTGLGYADSAKTKSTTIFDLKTLQPVKTIPALLDADGMTYDPVSNQVFVVGGDANAVLVVDAKTNRLVKTIDLGGSPEFLVTDDTGSLYININDKNEIVKIDTKTNAIIARWPVAPCDGPTGLAIDTASRRLFSSCENAVMVVVDADGGRIIATLPIGKGTDAAAFDLRRKLAFSSNRDGTLSVIRERGLDDFVVLGTVKTAPGARTLAVDPATGRIFLVTATVKSIGVPKHKGGPPSYAFEPGTSKALFFDPAS